MVKNNFFKYYPKSFDAVLSVDVCLNDLYGSIIRALRNGFAFLCRFIEHLNFRLQHRVTV